MWVTGNPPSEVFQRMKWDGSAALDNGERELKVLTLSKTTPATVWSQVLITKFSALDTNCHFMTAEPNQCWVLILQNLLSRLQAGKASTCLLHEG